MLLVVLTMTWGVRLKLLRQLGHGMLLLAPLSDLVRECGHTKVTCKNKTKKKATILSHPPLEDEIIL